MAEDLPLPTLTSLNTIKHGCRSRQLLLKHENPNDWIKLREMYMEEYKPQSEFMERLVDDAVRERWIFERNQTNLHTVQVDLPEDPRLWQPDHHHRIALFMRYQTTAERSFNRALARLQSHQKIQRNSEDVVPPKAQKKEVTKDPVVVEQWVEVRRIENQVITEFYPPNEEFEQQIKAADPKPDLVYRRLFFPDGVPAAYQWTRPQNGQATNGGLAIQRMTVETWLSLRDKERETGHAENTGEVTLRDWRDGG